MIIENCLEKRTFGPFASSMGLFLFTGGLVIAYFSLTGLIVALIGAFIAFTSTCTIIDTESRRIKHADYVFGLLPVGKWVHVQDSMKLEVRKARKGYTGYIKGNQQFDIQYTDFRIFLTDSGKQIAPLMKCKTCESAQNELVNLASFLNLKQP